MDKVKRIEIIYEVDLKKLIEELKLMSNEERMNLYSTHTHVLFPKSKRVVSIDELLNDNVKVNREKFRDCFMIICNDFFSTNHFGEYNVRRFKEKTGLKTDRFFQKVILSLSLMRYIKDGGLKCNYSSGNHGYIYQVDYMKWKGVEMDLWSSEPEHVNSPIDEYEWMGPEKVNNIIDREYNDVEKEWLLEKQLNTIRSMKIDRNVFRSMMKKKDEILSDVESRTWNCKELNQINNLERLHQRKKSIYNVNIDGPEGRLYSVMTNLKSDWRKNGTLHINGEGFCEVDLSSLHPTLFGLYVKNEFPDIRSRWIEHCLKGDFYEWVIDITGIGNFTVERLIKELESIVGVYIWRDDDDRKTMKNKVSKHKELIETMKKIRSDDPHVLFRPVVKQWMMEFLFSRFSMTSTEKSGDTIYKQFCHNLCMYLKEQEPYIYEKLVWFRSKRNLVPKKKDPSKMTSQLPLILQKEEVRYIKRCLERLDPEVRYLYTVHDCVGCLVSDGEKVKQIMEDVSLDMYGVVLKLKIEGSVYDDQLWKEVS